MGGSQSGSGSTNTTDETLSCAAQSIQVPAQQLFPPLVPLVARCLLIIAYIIILFFGIILSSFILYLVWKFKTFHNLSWVYATQITIVNIVMCVNDTGIGLVSILADQWLLGATMCVVIGATQVTLISLRTLLLMAIVIDRFCSVFMPYLYPKHRVKIICGKTVVIYLIAVLIAVLLGISDCYSFSRTSWNCRSNSLCSTECSIARRSMGFIVVVPSSVVPIILYGALFYKAKKSKIQEVGDVAGDHQTEKRERRATITFFLMFMSLFLTTTPSVIVSTILSVTGMATNSTGTTWFYVLDVSSLSLVKLTFIFDPIFLLRNKDVKDVVSELTWMPPLWCC